MSVHQASLVQHVTLEDGSVILDLRSVIVSEAELAIYEARNDNSSSQADHARKTQIRSDLSHSQNQLQAAQRERDHARQEAGQLRDPLKNAVARLVTPIQNFSPRTRSIS